MQQILFVTFLWILNVAFLGVNAEEATDLNADKVTITKTEMEVNDELMDVIVFESGPGTALEELFCLLNNYRDGDKLEGVDFPHPQFSELTDDHKITCTDKLDNDWTTFWSPGFYISVAGKNSGFMVIIFDEETAAAKLKAKLGKSVKINPSMILSKDQKTLTFTNELFHQIFSILDFSPNMGIEISSILDPDTNAVLERRRYQSASGKITSDVERSYPADNKVDSSPFEGEIVLHF